MDYKFLTPSYSNHFKLITPLSPLPEIIWGSEMPSPDLDPNKFPHSPQSPTFNAVGLEDLDATVNSFFKTNNFNLNDPKLVVDEARNNLEFRPEAESLPLQTQVRKKELSGLERQQAYTCLLERMHEGILKKGSTRVVAAMFGVGIRSMQKLWKRARDSGNHDHQSLRVRNCGRKRIEFDMERLRDIPMGKRTTIRGVAFAFGVSKQSCGYQVKRGSNQAPHKRNQALIDTKTIRPAESSTASHVLIQTQFHIV